MSPSLNERRNIMLVLIGSAKGLVILHAEPSRRSGQNIANFAGTRYAVADVDRRLIPTVNGVNTSPWMEFCSPTAMTADFPSDTGGMSRTRDGGAQRITSSCFR